MYLIRVYIFYDVFIKFSNRILVRDIYKIIWNYDGNSVQNDVILTKYEEVKCYRRHLNKKELFNSCNCTVRKTMRFAIRVVVEHTSVVVVHLTRHGTRTHTHTHTHTPARTS